MRRILVVGGGAAGGVAALAAKEAGAQVQVAQRAPGATALSAGVVEVASNPLGRLLPAVDAAKSLATRQPAPPYARLRSRLDQLPAALQLLQTRLAPLFAPGPSGADHFATALGGLRSGVLAQAAQAGGALRHGRRMAIGWFKNQPALLDGEFVAASIREAGFDATPFGLDYLTREEQLS